MSAELAQDSVQEPIEQYTTSQPLMRLTYVTDEHAWDHAATTLPGHHVLQSWGWGRFKARWGWTPTRLLWRTAEGEAVAAAQFLRRAIPHTPFGIGYVSKGPLLESSDELLASQVLADLEREARRQRCLFVKIDPDVEASNTRFVQRLETRGWQRGEPIQFPNTGIIDLRPDEEALLMDMKSKTRYNVRLAERRGVEVRDGTEEQYALFYEMYAETAERDGFLIRPRAYYLDLWHDFARAALAHLLIAWVDGTPVAGLVLFRYGDRAWYFYGASTSLHRRDMPTYALQWAAIEWARAQGLTEYDLWGAPTDLEDEEDPMAGVWRFKEGFGARFRAQIGAWDYPTVPLVYSLYTRGLPRIRERLGRG